MVTTCKAMVQHYNQDIDIHTVKIQSGSITTRMPHVICLQSYPLSSCPYSLPNPGPHFYNFIISKCYTCGNKVTFCNWLIYSAKFFGFPAKLLGELIVHSYLMRSHIPWYRYISLFDHSPVERHLSCFQVGDMMNKTTINILVQIFMWTQPFVSLDKLLGNMVATFFFFFSQRPPNCFPECLSNFTSPSAMYESFSFTTSCQHLALSLFFIFLL